MGVSWFLQCNGSSKQVFEKLANQMEYGERLYKQRHPASQDKPGFVSFEL